MSCLTTAEAHKHHPLCPLNHIEDTVHLISQQMAGSLIAPIVYQYRVATRSSYQCSRQQMGMLKRCGWSESQGGRDKNA